MARELIGDNQPKGANVEVTSDTTAVVSGIVDRAGFGGVEFLILAGTLADADATFVVLIEDGNASNLSDAAAVVDGFLDGTEALAGFTFAADQGARKIGYKGPKRYVRCTVTPAANTGSSPIGIVGLCRHPRSKPTANPPA